MAYKYQQSGITSCTAVFFKLLFWLKGLSCSLCTDNAEELFHEAERVVKIVYSFFLSKFLHWIGSSMLSKGDDPVHVCVETG